MAALVPNIWTGGQSNDLGGGQMNTLDPDQEYLLSLPFPPVLYREQLDCPSDDGLGHCGVESPWRELAPRQNGNPKIGPELSLGRDLWERHRGRRRFTLIKTATSGSSAADWDPDAVSGPMLFPRAVAYVRAYAQGPTRGLLWVHGESATASDGEAASYGTDLVKIFLAARAAFPELVIVLNLLHVDTYFDVPARAARVPTVRAGQLWAASQLDRVEVFSCDDLALKADWVHYLTASFLTMGSRAVDKFMLYPELLTIAA